MSKCSTAQMLIRLMPFMAVTLLQFGFAGLFIISKFALNRGMSPQVFVAYRHAVATVFIAPFAIIFDRPVMDQNLAYTGMKLTTATVTSALYNVLPAFAFIMAWVFRLEKVNLRSLHSQAKILGTIVMVGGAMLMTLINGPMLNFPWTRRNPHHESTVSTDHQDHIKGAIMVAAGCFCWAGFVTLQAITLKSYPAELSLTVWICLAGTVQGFAVALAFEWNNLTAWSIHFDSKLLAVVYCPEDLLMQGIMCSGIAFYIQGIVMKERGPVFVTAFNPLSLIIVAVMSSFILAEIMYLGRVIGAIVIVIGLYMVLWGKSKDQLPSELEKNDKSGYAGQNVIASLALNQGMSHFCGYAGQNVIASLALNQGRSHYVFLVYRMATATVLISPFALILDRLEKVNIRKLHSQGKVVGTIVIVGGAIILTLVKGPKLNFPWTKGKRLN
ncbi:hypothetical protein DVH24_023135 [Malus domestica]|uniref:EamA domain-containing protein n=1 Tax=Malus domestica TaxID=3750 RepID=A0A498KPG6_MALDO|nr:hypothetical protein DVH24_023135 [Malus domestica]